MQSVMVSRLTRQMFVFNIIYSARMEYSYLCYIRKIAAGLSEQLNESTHGSLVLRQGRFILKLGALQRPFHSYPTFSCRLLLSTVENARRSQCSWALVIWFCHLTESECGIHSSGVRYCTCPFNMTTRC